MAEGEVGVQRDTQDFRGPVQQSHCVADSHLRVESGQVDIGCEQSHVGFLGGNGQLLTIGTPHRMAHSWLALSSTSTMLGADTVI